MKAKLYSTHVQTLLTTMALLASLNPLLTFVRFMQQKEWRFDRAYVALREQGVCTTLCSVPRIIVIVLGILLWIISSNTQVLTAALAVLILINVAQVVLRKQRLPHWTSKAILTTFVALICTGIALVSIQVSTIPIVLLFVPLLQFVSVAIANAVLLPLDSYLKQRIFARTAVVRNRLHNTIVIAITGSVGKTTCKHILERLLVDKDVLCTPKFVNTELGTCNWFLAVMQKRTSEPAVLVIEMGAYKQGEITTMCSIFKPTISIITHVGTQHIALFGSQQKLLAAKTEIVEQLPKEGYALYQGNQWYSAYIAEHTKAIQCPISQQDLQVTEDANGITLEYEGQRLRTNIRGKYNAINVAFAYKAASLCGVSNELLIQTAPTLTLPDSTLTISTVNGYSLVDDSHNSSPESMQAILDWLQEQVAPHKVLICSGLIEQGSKRAAVQSAIGKKASTIVNELLCTDVKSAKELAIGYGKPVPGLEALNTNWPKGSTIVCEGRVPMQRIVAMLNNSKLR